MCHILSLKGLLSWDNVHNIPPPATAPHDLLLLDPTIHRKGLRELSIHFNTTNLVDDLRILSEDPVFHDLRSLPTRCLLKSSSVGRLRFPGGIQDEEITNIAGVLIDVFPSLHSIETYGIADWGPLSSRIGELRGVYAGSSPRKEERSCRMSLAHLNRFDPQIRSR